MRILECENIRNGDGKGTLRASGHVLGCLWDALELQKVRQVLPNGESSIGVLQIRGPGERPRSMEGWDGTPRLILGMGAGRHFSGYGSQTAFAFKNKPIRRLLTRSFGDPEA